MPEPTTIDQQFVEYVVKSLVGHPDDVSVIRKIDEKGVLLELTVHPEDLGRVIGRRGGTAQSLRTLLRALGTKNDARYNLKIIDNDRPADEQPKPVSVKQPSSEPRKDVEEPKEETVEERESVAARTRKELADLDDLDI
ncbi:MAG: KH domain-containing protein [Candidatus Chaera renei]|uniref:RNA-binding protein KhpA n=1 Tax=Candidatus Chaera renei TaxID=2506947 RepID=A0A4Q0AK31_9BACT|nr:MAG: KH domain-containing protein [Candidatus Chaera renei]